VAILRNSLELNASPNQFLQISCVTPFEKSALSQALRQDSCQTAYMILQSIE